MTHALIPLSESDRWAEALEGVPHAFAHTWGSCNAMRLTSGMETFLYRYDDGGHRVLCPLAVRSYEGYRDVLTPYGLSGFVGTGPCPGFPGRWAAFMREQGFVCGYVGLNPVLDQASYYDPSDRHVHNDVHVLDLTMQEAGLFAGMSVNRRRQVREWGRDGARIVLDRDRLEAFFGDRLAAFLDERRAARGYYLSRCTLEALFALDSVLALGVERAGRIEAVSVFAWTPHVGDFLFNVSTPAGRSASAALIWHGAMHLKAAGVPLLSLGGGIRPGDGVATFKARFGGQSLPLGALRQVYDRAVFTMLCERARASRDIGAAYFPPYHTR
ncbi:MAG TPA: hypothetical protein VGE02_16230 [Gemmatimonadales bacterium]